ncbi:hypothetical protein A5714_16055 [Mycobacterium sp. E2462]|uniref:hypothetical protein n=1 Tax=unclassified Mycobacterium TaxID=2642494 RepID=UPI0007FF65FD|nr:MULTISPECIES: hypothetical protein [unclassified Mycobacterium]OBG74419.1 hypothetical protein A5700_05230 [Mycobacterium sp. E1214]OBH25899.1 hypothetical protein A5693_05750 [Mycobacterium sp. E1319]OBI11570.1 hypothetical protein A5714_16055 [Mycobacterium sp. E2462]
MGDASVRTFVAGAALATVALTATPTARADMLLGNYRLDTNRDPGHSWIWSINPCTPKGPGCVAVYATPQPNGQAAPWRGEAHLDNGRYTLAVDVPDGVRCVVQFFPSHDVYSWDAVTLAGQVDSTFDTGCGGGPGGATSYPISLVRW